MFWKEKYDLTVGLEIHIQLDLLAKAFAPESNAMSEIPNQLISDVSLALPGTLPMLNENQIQYAVKLAMALNCQLNDAFFFDRKHYFYADLPKGYQITQDTAHYCMGGAIPYFLKNELKEVQLHHIHMEEDAGKSIHDMSPHHTYLDYNRSGTPLLEIVTEPDLHSADEVAACIDGMQQIAQYLEISTADMEKGKLRCDCNVSLSIKGSNLLGTRCEIKNLNSKKFAKKAILSEAARQAKILDQGGQIYQQTMNYDPKTNNNVPIRDKETLHDYRYFPDPDLPVFSLSENEKAEIRASIPALPHKEVIDLSTQFGLTHDDAILVTATRQEADFIKKFLSAFEHPKTPLNLYIQSLRSFISSGKLTYDQATQLLNPFKETSALIDENRMTAADAIQKVLPKVYDALSKDKSGQKSIDIEQIARENNLIISADDDAMSLLIDQVLTENADKVSQYKKGKTGLIGFFMGAYMRLSESKPDPRVLREAFLAKLQ